MSIDELRHLARILKSGEYDGTHIMSAWLALREYAATLDKPADAGVTDAELRVMVDVFYKAYRESTHSPTMLIDSAAQAAMRDVLESFAARHARQGDAVGEIVTSYVPICSVVSMYTSDLPEGTKLYAAPPAQPEQAKAVGYANVHEFKRVSNDGFLVFRKASEFHDVPVYATQVQPDQVSAGDWDAVRGVCTQLHKELAESDSLSRVKVSTIRFYLNKLTAALPTTKGER